jgi:YD repeat-containing protein
MTAESDKGVLGFLDLNWNRQGQVSRVKDHEGAEVVFEYDGRQRLLSARSGNRSVHYKYDAGDHLSTAADGERVWTYRCTPEGYLLQAQANGIEVHYAREETAGKGVRLRLSGAAAADLTYDDQGRLTREERGGVSICYGGVGEKSTREILVAGKPCLRAAHDRLAGTLELEFPGCRREYYELGMDGRPLRLKAVAGGKTTHVEFDPRGIPLRFFDPEGGEYRLVEGIGDRKLVTPAGTYSMASDRKGAAVRVGVPSGGESLWERQRACTVVTEVTAQGMTRWTLAAGSYEVWRDGRVITHARLDEKNRILELVDLLTDCKVSARYGTSAHVVRTPEGRQLRFRYDGRGQLEEIEEHPVGTGPIPSR